VNKWVNKLIHYQLFANIFCLTKKNQFIKLSIKNDIESPIVFHSRVVIFTNLQAVHTNHFNTVDQPDSAGLSDL